jgi:hypothetical protein
VIEKDKLPVAGRLGANDIGETTVFVDGVTVIFMFAVVVFAPLVSGALVSVPG